jgi:hypothetical protein
MPRAELKLYSDKGELLFVQNMAMPNGAGARWGPESWLAIRKDDEITDYVTGFNCEFYSVRASSLASP